MYVKNIIFILVLLLLFSCNEKRNFEKDGKIRIRNLLDTVEKKKKKYTQKTSEYMGMSSEGGEIIAYYEQGEIKYIETVIIGEMGKILYDCYFYSFDGRYLIETVIEYDMPLRMPKASVVKELKRKIIIEGQKQWLVDDDFNIVKNDLPHNYIEIINSFIKTIEN